MAKTGSLVFVKLDSGDLLVGQTSLSFSSACDMIDISSKDTGRHREYEAGKVSKTFSVGGIGSTTKASTGAGYFELETKQDEGTKVQFTITNYTDETAGTADSVSETKTGYAFISDISWDANDGEAISFSADFQVTGTPETTTNA